MAIFSTAIHTKGDDYFADNSGSQLGATGIWWVGARKASKHPLMHRTGPITKNRLAQNVSGARGWEILISKLHCLIYFIYISQCTKTRRVWIRNRESLEKFSNFSEYLGNETIFVIDRKGEKYKNISVRWGCRSILIFISSPNLCFCHRVLSLISRQEPQIFKHRFKNSFQNLSEFFPSLPTLFYLIQ